MIRKIDAEHTKNVTGDQNAFRKEDIICHSLNNSVFINSIGDVFPCISWPVKLGNIFEKSIAEIWNTSDVLQYLRSLKKSHMKFCGKCEYSTHCTEKAKWQEISVVVEGQDQFYRGTNVTIAVPKFLIYTFSPFSKLFAIWDLRFVK